MVKNKENWLFFAFFVAKTAKNLKNPTSSKNIDKKVIETNNTSILSGFIDELLVNPLNISVKEIPPKTTTKIAPNRQTSQ